MGKTPREAEAEIERADVIIAHNGKIDERHRRLIAGKPIVTMAHNYAWNVDTRFVQQGMPGVVVGQYQATLPEFAGWRIVPNPVPLWEPAFSPSVKPDVATVAYTPSGRHETYPADHRLYWHGKGYETTMRALEALSRRAAIEVLAVRDRQMSHADALAVKQRAHIVIDECVTGSYHRSSLEGLACGAVVVNGVGLLPEVARVLRHCAGSGTDAPFVHASLSDLESALRDLIETGPAQLAQSGRANRAWLEANWDFSTQWSRFWEPPIDDAVAFAARGRRGKITPGQREAAQCGGEPSQRSKSMVQQILATEPRMFAEEPIGLSAVIPFGDRRRLGLLASTLAGLRQSPAVDQVIVVELGDEPVALEAARRWDADHVFISSSGSFDKARALNTGSRLARRPDILWCDADLLLGADFLVRALQEFRAGGFDFLFPFSQIRYLGEADSRDVRSGARSPDDCRPVRVLGPMGGGAVGGMGLVRSDFLHRHGGLIEGFLGWGGEDNAWVRKASLLGRVGVTKHADQVVWHLHHPDSGAVRGPPARGDARYAGNVELLARILRIRTPEELLVQFPKREFGAPPWRADVSIGLVTVSDGQGEGRIALAGAWAQALHRAYGATTPMAKTGSAALAETLADLRADAVVVLADDPAACAALASVEPSRPTVLALGAAEATPTWPPASFAGAWLVAQTQKDAADWRRLGLRVWHRVWEEPSANVPDPVPVIVQPLSHLLKSADAPVHSERDAARLRRKRDSGLELLGRSDARLDRSLSGNGPTARAFDPHLGTGGLRFAAGSRSRHRPLGSACRAQGGLHSGFPARSLWGFVDRRRLHRHARPRACARAVATIRAHRASGATGQFFERLSCRPARQRNRRAPLRGRM